MVDHQKTLYEVMKRGVDSDQKLNHAYATGLLKKKTQNFLQRLGFLFSTKSNKKFLKVSKSRKQFMVSSILPKNERKNEKNRPNTTMIIRVQFFSFVFWENRGHYKLLSRFTDL